MRVKGFLFIILTATSCSHKLPIFEGQYWIPKVIQWENTESLDGHKIGQAAFSTLYFTTDNEFYMLSSYQNIDFDTDSIGYGVEPGFNLFRGAYKVTSDSIYLEYKQLYGSIITSNEAHRERSRIQKNPNNQLTIAIDSVEYIQTTRYSEYSKSVINGQIKSVVKKPRND